MQRYKGEVFVSSYIKSVLNDRNFDEILGRSDKAAWEAFVLVVNNLKMPIHRQLVELMLASIRKEWLSYVAENTLKSHLHLKIHIFLECYPAWLGKK